VEIKLSHYCKFSKIFRDWGLGIGKMREMREMGK
jgi:hypothetical protein